MNALAKGLNVKDDVSDLNKLSPKWMYSLINGGQDNESNIDFAYSVLKDNGAPSLHTLPYDTNYKEWNTEPLIWTEAVFAKIKVPPPRGKC